MFGRPNDIYELPANMHQLWQFYLLEPFCVFYNVRLYIYSEICRLTEYDLWNISHKELIYATYVHKRGNTRLVTISKMVKVFT